MTNFKIFITIILFSKTIICLEKPIFKAVKNNDKDKLTILLKYGVKINAKNQFRQNALTVAIKELEDVDIAKILIDAKININSQDYTGYTPLMHAVKMVNVSKVIFLLQNGANIHVFNGEGYDASDIAENMLRTVDSNQAEDLSQIIHILNNPKEYIIANKQEVCVIL